LIANFFTKPLQGALFRKFRDIILGYKHISTLHDDDEESSPQERVRKDISKGSDNGPSVVSNGPSVVGKADTEVVSYAEVVKGRRSKK
jgi:hypothetical protein